MEYTRRSKEQAMVLKLDFEKAYDQVNWKFLDRVMKRRSLGIDGGGESRDVCPPFGFRS